MGGAIFETAVLSEIMKVLAGRGEERQIYFWRTSTGVEVDIVVVRAGELVPIEVKLSATPLPAMAESIMTFQRDFGGKTGPGYVVHPGDVRLPLSSGVTAIPFTDL
jgi:predicted AAA+ superfamily ATPase